MYTRGSLVYTGNYNGTDDDVYVAKGSPCVCRVRSTIRDSIIQGCDWKRQAHIGRLH